MDNYILGFDRKIELKNSEHSVLHDFNFIKTIDHACFSYDRSYLFVILNDSLNVTIQKYSLTDYSLILEVNLESTVCNEILRIRTGRYISTKITCSCTECGVVLNLNNGVIILLHKDDLSLVRILNTYIGIGIRLKISSDSKRILYFDRHYRILNTDTKELKEGSIQECRGNFDFYDDDSFVYLSTDGVYLNDGNRNTKIIDLTDYGHSWIYGIIKSHNRFIAVSLLQICLNMSDNIIMIYNNLFECVHSTIMPGFGTPRLYFSYNGRTLIAVNRNYYMFINMDDFTEQAFNVEYIEFCSYAEHDSYLLK